MKYILILIGLFLIIVGASECQPAKPKAQLTPADHIFYSQERDTPLVAALRVVPGSDWTLDTKDSLVSYGAMFISQNGSNSRESRLTLATLLDYMQDSISGGTQSLTYTNDSLTISGSNTIVITGFADSTITADTLAAHLTDLTGLKNYRRFNVDNLSEISGNTFAVNSLLERRSTGARYIVQSDTIAGYPIDSIAVIPTGSGYAILENDQIKASHFISTITDTTVQMRSMAQKAINYAIARRKNLTIDRTFAIDTAISFSGARNMRVDFVDGGRIHQTGMVIDTQAQSVTGTYNVFTIENSHNVVFNSPYITGDNPSNFILGLGLQSQAFTLLGSEGSESSNLRFNDVRIDRIVGSAFFSSAGTYLKNVIIDGGSITNCAKSAANISCENTTIQNVRIERCRSGAEMANSRNTKFRNNYVKNIAHSGVAIGGNTGSILGADSTYRTDIDSLTVQRKHEGNIISDNTFYRCGIALDTLFPNGNAISLAPGAIRTIIQSNTIYYCGHQGISIASSAVNNPIVRPMIINNRIVNASLASSTQSKAGIYSDVPAIVMGNTIEKLPEDTMFNMNRGIFFTATPHPIDSTDSPFRDSIYVAMNNFIDVPFQGVYIQGVGLQPVTIVERNNVFVDAGLVLGSNATETSESVDNIFGSDGTLAGDRSLDLDGNYLHLEGFNNESDIMSPAGGMMFMQSSTANLVGGIYRYNDGGQFFIQGSGSILNTSRPYFRVTSSTSSIGTHINKLAAGSEGSVTFIDGGTVAGKVGIYESTNSFTGLVRGTSINGGVGVKIYDNTPVDIQIGGPNGSGHNEQIWINDGTTTEQDDTPVSINLGGNYGSSHTTGHKLYLLNNTSNGATMALGASPGQMNYYSSGSTHDHVFYPGAVEGLRLHADDQHVEVKTHLDVGDYVSVTDSIIVNGISIFSGTSAPTAGIGTQGSLYMRNDNDSTLYTKTSGGWTLLN